MLHQQITPPATPAQVSQRSYTLTEEPQGAYSTARGMDWALRCYGHGNDWTVRSGERALFSTIEAAQAAGERWRQEGRGA